MARKQYMLTTVDNPFNPFEQFEEWYLFDKEKGYDCCEKLDRFVEITDEMSEIEKDMETERAINKIISIDFLDIYTKVSKDLNDVPDDIE